MMNTHEETPKSRSRSSSSTISWNDEVRQREERLRQHYLRIWRLETDLHHAKIALYTEFNVERPRTTKCEQATQTSEPEQTWVTSSAHAMEYVLVTAEQLADWSASWSPLSCEEYTALALRSSGNVEQQEIHLKGTSQTKLPDGRNSILVDLGSRINVVGKNTMKEFTDTAAQFNLETKYQQRRNRLLVNGVGSDAAYCDQQAEIPIAVKFQDMPATKESFLANVAEGCGADLPAILGAVSMQAKDSVLLLRPGKEMIVFPGPGGYKIEWSPGSRQLEMVQAPSGHLVIPCDRFADLTSPVQEDDVTFWTDHTTNSG